MTELERMIEISKTEDIGDPYYFKTLKISSDSTVESYLPGIFKRLPKKVKWAKVTLHLENSKEEYLVYEHSDKKVIRDRRSFANENYGKFKILKGCSNIDYGEYYYDIWVDDKISKKPENKKKNITKPVKNKVQKPSKQNIILDYSTMSKTELKKILSNRGVRVYYHDTLQILRNKCKESER